METIKNIISHSLNTRKYFQNNKVCFMDIETTGLSRSNNMVYLIGVLYFDDLKNSWLLKQYFANSMDKEQNILEEFISSLSFFDKIITFNGDSFDIPFIEHRLKHYDIDYTFYKTKSFDLYQFIKRNRYFLNLPNLKLKTIESNLGFIREDIYSGYDCIKFYYEYIKSNNILLKENILKHNYDDLVHMLDIISILDLLDDKKSFHLDLEDNPVKFTIESIETMGDMINIRGSIDTNLKNNIKYFGENYSIITENLNSFMASVEFKRGYISKDEQCIYINSSGIEYLKNHKDSSGYKLPPYILVLMIEKKYCVDNIKEFLIGIFKNIFV